MNELVSQQLKELALSAEICTKDQISAYVNTAAHPLSGCDYYLSDDVQTLFKDIIEKLGGNVHFND